MRPSRSKIRRRTPNRKTLQLCRQVQRTLELTLSGDFDDAVLQGLLVESVVPAPDAANLLVTVRPFLQDGTPIDQIMQKLDIVAGRLRTEVARAITRKRAPNLMFRVFQNPDETRD